MYGRFVEWHISKGGMDFDFFHCERGVVAMRIDSGVQKSSL